MSSSTTSRRQGLSGNAAIKTPCYLATTANITLSGEQTIDGVTTSASRVLVKNQTTGANNGIYVSDSGTWERDLDFDGAYDCACGTLIFVTNGSANGAGLFQLTTADPITIGTTSLTFTKIATLANSSVTQTQVQNGQFVNLTSVAGTNTITGTTVGTAPSANGVGQYIFFTPANTNTGAATLNRDSLGALSIFYNGAALIGGELIANVPALVYEDGTQYQLIATAWANTNYQTVGSVASSSTVVLDTAKPYAQITGAVTITAITLGNGRKRIVEFASTPLLTNGASLILPTGANITAAAGDTACFIGEASSVVRCVWYQRASGNTVAGSSNVLRSYLAGLTMSTAGSSGTMSIAAGQATDSTNSQTMTLSSSIAKTTSSWAVGSASGGLDTGAIANSTWYHFWLIQRTDTNVVDVLCSLSATSPTMPTNYTLKRRIGSGLTDGSAHWVAFTQGGDMFELSVPVLETTSSNAGTNAVTQTLVNVPSGVNLDALLNVFTSGSGAACYISDLATTDAAPSVSAAPGISASTQSNNLGGQVRVRTNTSAQIRTRLGSSGSGEKLNIITCGWIDRRGRDD